MQWTLHTYNPNEPLITGGIWRIRALHVESCIWIIEVSCNVPDSPGEWKVVEKWNRIVVDAIEGLLRYAFDFDQNAHFTFPHKSGLATKYRPLLSSLARSYRGGYKVPFLSTDYKWR